MNTLSPAQRLGRVALLATCAGLPLQATAAYPAADGMPGFYLGVGVGYDKLEGESFSGNIDDDGIEDSRVTYKAVAGYHLGRVLSLEAQYVNFGTAKDGNNVVKADGMTAGILLHYPEWPSIKPYAKAGVLFWDADGRFNNLSRREDGSDFTYGAGLRFALTDRVDMRAEYEAFEFDETDVDHLSVIVQFAF